MKAAHCKGLYNLCRLEFIGVVANVTGEKGDKISEQHESNRDNASSGDDDKGQEGQDWKFLKRRIN